MKKAIIITVSVLAGVAAVVAAASMLIGLRFGGEDEYIESGY